MKLFLSNASVKGSYTNIDMDVQNSKSYQISSGGPGALVSREDLNLGGAYETQ